jgi:hypothetical protein
LGEGRSIAERISLSRSDGAPRTRRCVITGSLFSSLVVAVCSGAASLPTELNQALVNFRAEGPKGWSFVQTTSSGGETLVEGFDPMRPDFKRWALLQKNERRPTESELRTYNETQTRRSSGFSAPRIQDQIDLASATRVASSADRSIWRFRLKAGGFDDSTAEFMAATITFHLETKTIERIELGSTEAFSPAFGVKIVESKTIMIYSLPSADRPSLLTEVSLHIRGRAFWVKSLNQDMTLLFSNYAWAGKKRL